MRVSCTSPPAAIAWFQRATSWPVVSSRSNGRICFFRVEYGYQVWLYRCVCIYNMVMLCQYCNTSKKCRSNFHQCPLIQLWSQAWGLILWRVGIFWPVRACGEVTLSAPTPTSLLPTNQNTQLLRLLMQEIMPRFSLMVGLTCVLCDSYQIHTKSMHG